MIENLAGKSRQVHFFQKLLFHRTKNKKSFKKTLSE